MASRFWREPIVVFFLVGAGLFGIVEYQDSRDAQIIEVNRDVLLDYVQQQSKSYDLAQAQQRLSRMPPQAVSNLVNEYVREEALYRQAISLGFDADDYVIRRRLVQKVEFMAEGAAKDDASVISEESLRSHYKNNLSDYGTQANLTFTHAFLRHDSEEAATSLLTKLNDTAVSFNEAGRYGERFTYHLNYVERDYDLIESHFGQDMAAELFALEPNEQIWRGPFRSQHGWHLVLVSSKQNARIAPFHEVQEKLRNDVRAKTRKQYQSNYLAEMVSTYEVELDEDLPLKPRME